jgi:2-haloacid dehalogenase
MLRVVFRPSLTGKIPSQVFGTVVDLHTTVFKTLRAAAAYTLNSASASIPSAVRLRVGTISWPHFAQLWRTDYEEFCATYDPSAHFIPVDEHTRSSLVQRLEEYGLIGLWTDDEIVALSRVWHYPDAWPDAAAGLEALNQRFRTCTLSNENIDLLEDMAKHAGLPWSRILSAEHFKAFKPSSAVYLGAAEQLGLRPGECAMVSAHLEDLQAAKKCGYQTIYVEREGEELASDDEVSRARREAWVDMWIAADDNEAGGGFLEIAKRFDIT